MQNYPWYNVRELSQLPLAVRLWVLWCAKGPKRSGGGSLGGSALFKLLQAHLRRSPVGDDNLFPVRFDNSLEAFVDLLDNETYQHTIRAFSQKSSELRVFDRLLDPGDGMIDVGANQGTIAIPASRRVGSAGHVVAFEPQPRPARALRLTKARNKLSQLDVIEAAASDRPGEQEFYLSAGSSGAATFLAEPNARASSISVPLKTVDEIANGMRTSIVRLLKVDVEGAEPQVINGARNLLRRFSPFISCEFSPASFARNGQTTATLIDLLREVGFEKFYDIGALSSSRRIEIGETVDGVVNVLAVPRQRVDEFEAKFSQ